MSNFAPSSTLEHTSTSWDFGSNTDTFGTGNTVSSYEFGNEMTPSSSIDTSWDSPTNAAFEGQFVQPESSMSERLRELKDKAIHGMGRRALDAVMNRLPDFSAKESTQAAATNLYEDPAARRQLSDGFNELRVNPGMYSEQAGQFAMNAGREIAGAGLVAAKESVMNYYGLEKDENEKLRVARKIKFGKAVVKTLVNPVGTASSVGVRAGRAARKAGKQEAFGQVTSARQKVLSFTPDTAATATWDANNW